MPPEHGEHDSAQQKWFCGYWMSQAEWLDIHDYAPMTTTAVEKEQEGTGDDDDDDDGAESGVDEDQGQE